MTLPNDDFELPPALQRKLRELYEGPAFPAGRDGAILAAAKRRRGWSWRAVVSGSIAAAIAVAGTLFVLDRASHQPQAAMHAAGEAAYVRTGDIRDAFYVARQLKANKALEAGWDANGDGVVDEKDVQTLAMAAVKLTDVRDASPRGGTP